MTPAPWSLRVLRAVVVVAVLLAAMAAPVPAGAAPEGTLTWAVHISIAPTWFDPGEHAGIITSMMTFYALHDALVKPMPGHAMTPSLAESWSASKDGLTYEFVLGYPEVDDLFARQAREGDRGKRAAILHQIQQLMHEKTMFAPIWELAFINGVGPRVEESGLGRIEYQPYSSPYEDLRLKR
jgi:ABC-type transport system substrate-binding protein